MIKFLLQNKLQLLLAFSSNLIIFMFLIYVIAYKLLNYIGAMSVLFGLIATYFFVINIKKYDKLIRLRITVFYVLGIVLMRYISTFILDPSEVLSGTGIFVGFMLWIIVWNIADTVHNIREKSKLTLQDLETE